MTIYTENFVKDPNAVKDYTVDWTAWLGTDTISASSWTVPSGIANITTSNTSTKATIWLSGGAIATDYEVYNTIITAGGRTDRAMIKIQVR